MSTPAPYFARKRKRVAAPTSALMVYRPYKSPFKRSRRTFQPGVDRTGGYYGRYSGRGSELKFHDVTVADTTIIVTGQIQNAGTVNVIPQGVTESQRVGRKCTIKSIAWNIQVVLPEQDAGATPLDGDILRIILYLDKQCNGATATVTDILETAEWHSHYNLANQNRFRFLMDKSIAINYASMASDGAGVVSQATVKKYVSFFKSCNIPIEFSSTTGAIGEIRSNNLGVLLITDTDNAQLGSRMRLRFSDQ